VAVLFYKRATEQSWIDDPGLLIKALQADESAGQISLTNRFACAGKVL